MRLTPGPGLVKRALASHSWIGLLVGALMYLVCLTGALAVFYPQFERWEQPTIQETRTYDSAALTRTFNKVMGEALEVTDHMFVSLPTDMLPRLAISNENGGMFINADGSLGEPVNHEWTHLLIFLHLYLHLPESIGIALVSILGAMLCGLIISGLLAHPNILRDAFSFRLGGSRQLEQVDLHNRLSVWGIPFHLMIGITGAYFGLVIPMMGFVAGITGQDRGDISGSLFGHEPDIEQTVQRVNVGKAIEHVKRTTAGAEPISVTLHNAGTGKQFMDVHATMPERLIWAEQYRFDPSGHLLGTGGYADGPAGKQAVYSIYRVHFGHFGGLPTQIIYGLLGLALTVVSVTGVNIWLEKRRGHDAINDIWTGIVWGAPIALTLSAITQVILGIPSVPVFWLGMILAVGAGLALKAGPAARSVLLTIWAATLALLITGYLIKFGLSALSPAALPINLILLGTLIVLVGYGIRRLIALPPEPHESQNHTDRVACTTEDPRQDTRVAPHP